MDAVGKIANQQSKIKNENDARRCECRTRRGRRIRSNPAVVRTALGGGRRRLLCGRGRLRRVDADELALPALVLKLDHAVDEREQRIVLAAADVLARLPLRPALPREDVAAQNDFAAKLLQAESLRVRVAAVTR